jgi:hypothetical protein
MLSISEVVKNIEIKKSEIKLKNWRDELVTNFTQALNKERVISGYKPLTKKAVALLINRNPYLSKNDGEVDLLFKDCIKKGNFKKFWWATSIKKK